MSAIFGVILLVTAAVLASPSNFGRTIDYFVGEREKIGLPREQWNQRLALAGFIVGLAAVGLVLLF